jgi:hypothetical protein
MLAALTAAALVAAPPACADELPHGPRVAAPIVVKTSCGGFRLDSSGEVTRLPRRWFALHASGTGRRYGADLQIRRNPAGRITLLRRGRVVWSSSGLYPRTGGDVGFGPGAFAFASYYSGLFLTDLAGPERLVLRGRGLFPYDFFADGRLIVVGGPHITVLSPTGRIERRYPYSRTRRASGLAFDAERDTLYFVTRRQRLATLHGTRLRVGRRLAVGGNIGLAGRERLLFAGGRSLTLTTREGRVIAHAGWTRRGLHNLDSGATVSADGRTVAFRLSDARPGARKGRAVVYLLTAGQRGARAVYRHRLGPVGCGTGAGMAWHAGHLLYSSADGEVAILQADGSRRDLTRFVKRLPRRGRTDRPVVSWRADYPA